jgi:cytosine/adenosine deaminase-related metal-dependent hydrolase
VTAGTIIWAGLALPEAGANAESDWGVYVQDDRIADSGARDALRARYPAAEMVGGPNALLMPALVNSHDHGRAIGTLPLGVPDDMLEIWIPGLWSQPAFDPYLAAAYEALTLLTSGVGTVMHSQNPQDWGNLRPEAEATLRGYHDAGVRVAYHIPLLDQNPLTYGGEAGFLAGLPDAVRSAAEFFLRPGWPALDAYLELCTTLWEAHHDARGHRVHIQISPCGGQWCSDGAITACVAWARERGTRVQMHLLETRYQRAYAERTWGASFVRHLEALGALGPWLTLAHMVWVNDADLALLAERKVGVVHNPSSNLRLRSGLAPIPAMVASGIRLGIGLDGQALDDDQDYLRELRLAWTLANRPGAGSPTLAARQFLGMGTRSGAALTLEGAPLGGLAVGDLADLVLLDWEAVRGVWASPELDPAELLLRRGARRHVTDVMVGGRWTVRAGRPTQLDLDEVAAGLRRSVRRAADGAPAEHARALAPYLRAFYRGWDEGPGAAR